MSIMPTLMPVIVVALFLACFFAQRKLGGDSEPVAGSGESPTLGTPVQTLLMGDSYAAMHGAAKPLISPLYALRTMAASLSGKHD